MMGAAEETEQVMEEEKVEHSEGNEEVNWIEAEDEEEQGQEDCDEREEEELHDEKGWRN